MIATTSDKIINMAGSKDVVQLEFSNFFERSYRDLVYSSDKQIIEEVFPPHINDNKAQYYNRKHNRRFK